MTRRKVDLRKVFLPSDSIAFIVIIMGLFIALFLDEMAVRLIGVCIAVLGGVALFMMVSPRLSDVSMPRPPRPTESPSFMSQTTNEGGQTRQVFDSKAYKETFGLVDQNAEGQLDENQIELFPELMDSSADPPQRTLATLRSEERIPDVEFADGQSSVRVVGVRSKPRTAQAPALAIASRLKKPPVQLHSRLADESPTGTTPPAASPDLVITSKVTNEIQISDEVIVRPKGAQSPVATSSEEPQAQQPTVAIKQPAEANVPPSTSGTPSTPESEVHDAIPRKPIRVSHVMVDDGEEMEASDEPRKEFDYLLNRVLMVIRSATSARTAAFFWFNKDKQQLVLEAKISDASEQLTEERKLPIGKDVVSQIALEGMPQIVSEITPYAELDLLPYYTANAGTVSFVGVPVYFKGSVVGVLCADTMERNAYSDVTVGFFGNFTKLISGLVFSYTSKFELQQNSRTLEAIQQFRSSVAEKEPTIDSVLRSLFDVVIKLMDISTIGACAYDAELRVWTIRNVKSVIPEYAELIGAPVDLERAIVGECIRNGEPIALSAEENDIRLTPSEPLLELTQFVALPMRSLLHTHGALFVENHQGTITNQDVSTLELLADLAGEMIAGIREQAREHVSAQAVQQPVVENAVAEPTLSDEEQFFVRLREEVARAHDYSTPFTLCYVCIDALVGASKDDAPHVLHAFTQWLVQRIHDQLREYDAVAVLSDDTIGVALVANSARETEYWAESLRREVAKTSLEVVGKQWSATVSIGIAQLAAPDTWQVLLENTQTALDISSRNKNKVTVYS